jgi:hypothetical protein
MSASFEPKTLIMKTTPVERWKALQRGASALQTVYPTKTQVSIYVELQPNTLSALAVFLWPGVVRVVLSHNGALVAQSKPGKPFELNPCVQ